MEKPEQIGVAVGILVNQSKSDALHWVRDVLTSAVEERKAWEDMQMAQKEIAAAANSKGENPAEEEAETPEPPSICKLVQGRKRACANDVQSSSLIAKNVGWPCSKTTSFVFC